ncbi:MAG: hypothetical protein HY747_00675 [Elusimicrobia bacterium]|nr:hypothetical protein [Elusimicrobiota bacterium]
MPANPGANPPPPTVIRPIDPHQSVTVMPGVPMPGGRVVSYPPAPTIIPAAPPNTRTATYIGYAAVPVYHQRYPSYNYNIYFWSGYYWGRHYDHFDYWYGDQGYWWCPHHSVYLDWGFPVFFIEHYYRYYPAPVVTKYWSIGTDLNLYQNGTTFYYWDTQLYQWSLLSSYQMITVGNSLYYRHGSSTGQHSHYDRYIPEAGLVYCSQYNTYYMLKARQTTTDEYVSEYDLWWSYAYQMYVAYLSMYY